MRRTRLPSALRICVRRKLQARSSVRGANMNEDLEVRWLGRMEFPRCARFAGRIRRKKTNDHSLGDELLLLEHEPVYTIGRNAGSIQPARRDAFAASAVSDQSRRPGHLSRSGSADRISDYRSAPMRAGFASLSALDRRSARSICCRTFRHCGNHAFRSHRCVGRRAQDRVDRRRCAPLDQYAWLRAERVRRSFTFRSDHAVRDRQRDDDFDGKRIGTTAVSVDGCCGHRQHKLRMRRIHRLTLGKQKRQPVYSMIPLEDNFTDIIGKAQRGLGISDGQLAEKQGLAQISSRASRGQIRR